jgi:hypothetical protein
MFGKVGSGPAALDELMQRISTAPLHVPGNSHRYRYLRRGARLDPFWCRCCLLLRPETRTTFNFTLTDDEAVPCLDLYPHSLQREKGSPTDDV